MLDPINAQIPKPLQPGDLLCVIAPSGGLQATERFEEGLAVWRDRGYRLHLCKNHNAQWGYLAGTDQQRRQQLTEALQHPECRGILCARGGYGGTRLLENWQWPKLSEPKWLIGFSDITSLLWSLHGTGVSGVHGPVLTTLAAEPSWTRDRLFGWVEHHALPSLTGKGWTHRNSGQATGRLLPGNLCVATDLLGTSAEPPIRGAILAFEDVGEAPYRIDRMLTHWRATGKLAQVKGIALGRFSGAELTKPGTTLSVEEVLRDRLSDLDIPVVSELPFGHDGENAALPVGLLATLDADTGTLSWPQT